MKRLIFAFLTVYIFVFSAFSQATEWKIDKSHSNVGFTVMYLVVSEVTGRFNDFDGSFKSFGEDFDGSQIKIVIQTASIYTDHEKRDDDLRSGNFFNAEKNPEIIFNSTSFKKVNEEKYEITGDLNMNGVTREVVLDAALIGTIKDPRGGIRAGFKARTTVDRYEFNLKYNKVLEAGSLLISQNVDIEINIGFIKK